jgi:hypothetical protein
MAYWKSAGKEELFYGSKGAALNGTADFDCGA